MLQHLKEVHPSLDISSLKEEFGRPTEGRLDIQATDEPLGVPKEVDIEEGAIVQVD